MEYVERQPCGRNEAELGEPVAPFAQRFGQHQVDHQHDASGDQQRNLRQGREEIKVHRRGGHHSLLLATCASSSVTDACITSVNGFGETPMNSTTPASVASSQNSRRDTSLRAATRSPTTAPNQTRLYIQSVYASPRISVTAARKPTQKFALTAARITMNSPTNPLVPGKPALAIANSIASAAKRGIVLTNPRNRRSAGCACGRTARPRKETSPPRRNRARASGRVRP